MRYLVCVLTVFCLATIHNSDQSKLSPAEQEVLDVRNARTEASNNRDAEAWTRYIADDCIFSSDAGGRLTKAQVSRPVANFPPEYDHSVDPREAVVHVYGDGAQFAIHRS